MGPLRRVRTAVLASLLSALGCAPESRERPPSVVLVSLDTLRADHVGLYGYGRDTTPFLDRFARQCLTFENALAPAPWTLISHMTMLTGLYPVQHGVVERDLALHPENVLLAERLQRAGYQTVGLYCPGWIHPRHGFDRGFDVFRGHADAEAAAIHLSEELARLDPERPVFLFLHLFDAHSGPLERGERAVYRAPPPYQEFFAPGVEERLPAEPAEVQWDSVGKLEPQELEAIVATYDGGIRHVDARLEEMFATLEHAGWLADTLVIVTSDHGEALGQREGRLKGHGGYYQEGLRVPLLVRHPGGLRAGERVAGVVSLADIVPTIFETTGLETTGIEAALPGQSLFAPIASERVVAAAWPAQLLVFQGPRKLRRTPDGTTVGIDLAADPLEEAPGQARPGEFDSLWRGLFPAGKSWPSARSIGEIPPAELDELRRLGYVGEGGE